MNADIPAEEFVRKIVLELISAIDPYRDGVVSNTDTECLHQYRVKVRKLRSLISLLKSALPEQTAALLKTKLSLVFKRTNTLRDLDVFLLDESEYRKLLPDIFDEGLSELYALIRKQQQNEQKKVARYLLSKSYSAEIATCTKRLSASPSYGTELSARPIGQVAKKLLLGRYRKMLKMNSGINGQSADEDIHALRIEIKKFRYLLEFFSGFFPKKSISQLINNVKKLQTVLGKYNDYSSQVGFLKSYLDNNNRLEMSKSLSGLISVLYQKQEKGKVNVDKNLKCFFTKNMSQRIDLLFG